MSKRHTVTLHHVITVNNDMFNHNGWRDVSFGQEEDSMEGRLARRCEVSSTESLQILCRSDSKDEHASDFRAHP